MTTRRDPAVPASQHLQQWMQAVITHPDGPAAGAGSEAAARWLAGGADSVDSVIRPSRSLNALERIGIYAGMYFPRLLDCLAEDFPALRYALGDEFEPAMRRYVADVPSTSWTLNRLGAALPRWLAERAATATSPHGPFLAELASLERTISEVFDDVAGAADACGSALTAAAILAIPRERWPFVRFEVEPALRLLAFDHPVEAWYRAFREGEQPALPVPGATAPSCVAVYRREFTVWRLPLSPSQHALLGRLAAGDALGRAIEVAAPDDDAAAAAFVGAIGNWFQEWAAEGFFRAATAE